MNDQDIITFEIFKAGEQPEEIIEQEYDGMEIVEIIDETI